MAQQQRQDSFVPDPVQSSQDTFVPDDQPPNAPPLGTRVGPDPSQIQQNPLSPAQQAAPQAAPPRGGGFPRAFGATGLPLPEPPDVVDDTQKPLPPVQVMGPEIEPPEPPVEEEGEVAKIWRILNTPLIGLTPEMLRILEDTKKESPWLGKVGGFGTDVMTGMTSPLSIGMMGAGAAGAAARATIPGRALTRNLTRAGGVLGTASVYHGGKNLFESKSDPETGYLGGIITPERTVDALEMLMGWKMGMKPAIRQGRAPGLAAAAVARAATASPESGGLPPGYSQPGASTQAVSPALENARFGQGSGTLEPGFNPRGIKSNIPPWSIRQPTVPSATEVPYQRTSGVTSQGQTPLTLTPESLDIYSRKTGQLKDQPIILTKEKPIAPTAEKPTEAPTATVKDSSAQLRDLVMKYEMGTSLTKEEFAQVRALDTPENRRGRSKPFLDKLDQLRNSEGGTELSANPFLDPKVFMKHLGYWKEWVRGLKLNAGTGSSDIAYDQTIARARQLINAPMTNTERAEFLKNLDKLRSDSRTPVDQRNAIEARMGLVRTGVGSERQRPLTRDILNPDKPEIGPLDYPRLKTEWESPLMRNRGLKNVEDMTNADLRGDRPTIEDTRTPGEIFAAAKANVQGVPPPPASTTLSQPEPVFKEPVVEKPKPIEAPPPLEEPTKILSKQPVTGEVQVPPTKVELRAPRRPDITSHENMSNWARPLQNGVSELLAKQVEILDAKNAPDIDYKAHLTGGNTTRLMPGETWRGRVITQIASGEMGTNPQFLTETLNKARSRQKGTTLGMGFGPVEAMQAIGKTTPMMNFVQFLKSSAGNPDNPSMARQIYELGKSLPSVDLPYLTSAAFRQGMPDLFTKNWIKAWQDAQKSYGDVATHNLVMSGIKSNPMYEMAQKAGIEFTEMGRFSMREEVIRGQLAEKIPIYGEHVRKSNQMYTAFNNSLRMSKFADLVETMGAHKDLVLQKHIADYVNVATGRGNINYLGQNAQILADTFFSPKLMASRAQLLGNYFDPRIPAQVRQLYLESMLRTAAAWGTMVQLGKLAGATTVSDPTNDDFGKVIFPGGIRLDVAGGYQQYLVLLARLASGGITRSSDPKKFIPFGGKGVFDPTMGNTTGKFLLNKMNPTASLFWEFANAKENRPFHTTDEMLQRALPLFAQDLQAVFQKNPALAAPLAALSSSGMGTSVHEGYDPEKLAYPFIPEKYQMEYKGQYGKTLRDIFNVK